MKIGSWATRNFLRLLLQRRLMSNAATGPGGMPNSTANPVGLASLPYFRTSETNPANFNSSHLGRFYKMDPELLKFLYGAEKTGVGIGIPDDFYLQCKTLTEACLLVRKPFLDLKQCIETYDPNLPTLRYILYGIPGSGKSISLVNMVQYAYAKEYVIVHVHWAPYFTRFITDTVPSTLREGFYDHTTMAVKWLTTFKIQNSSILKKLQLTTNKDYEWSKRELTPKGSPLEEIVEHGIARPVFASESIYALVEQLKISSTEKRCKTMVLIDGVNAFYYDSWRIRRPDRTEVPCTQITLFEAFKQAFKPDWSGGAVVCTVDKKANFHQERESDMPRYLLTKKGWEEFDPFIPVYVDVYTPQEVETTIDYFLERKWLQHPLAGTEKARKELLFLSTRNPKTLMDLCASR